MRTRRFLWVLCVVVAMLIAAAAAQPQEIQDGWHVIKMTARKYRYDPDVITVKKGEKVRLIMTALDRDHGFELKAFDINQNLKKGDPTVIEFTAVKVGTFEFNCSVFCGLGHRKMKGRLVVEP